MDVISKNIAIAVVFAIAGLMLKTWVEGDAREGRLAGVGYTRGGYP